MTCFSERFCTAAAAIRRHAAGGAAPFPSAGPLAERRHRDADDGHGPITLIGHAERNFDHSESLPSLTNGAAGRLR